MKLITYYNTYFIMEELAKVEKWLRANQTITLVQKETNAYGDKKRLAIFYKNQKEIGMTIKSNGVLIDTALTDYSNTGQKIPSIHCNEPAGWQLEDVVYWMPWVVPPACNCR